MISGNRHDEDDDVMMMVRVSEVVRGLKEGQFQWDWIPPGPQLFTTTNAPIKELVMMIIILIMFALVIKIIVMTKIEFADYSYRFE